jgi:hypothetical protein
MGEWRLLAEWPGGGLTTGRRSSESGRGEPHKRSSAAKQAFQQRSPCPSTGKRSGKCLGDVLDHVVPLKRGGRDESFNMQWQTVADAKVKDRTE